MYKIGHHGLSCSYFYKADEKHLTVAPPQSNKKGTSACFAYLQLVGLKKKISFQAFPLAQAEKLDTTVQKQYSDEQVSEALSISEQRE